jgi:glutamate-1-semialdehyde 2,1-aminomutase
MSVTGPQTKAWYAEARKVFPYGVNSNFRYWGDDDTFVVKRGKGSHIWDADDREYVDYRLAFGPIIIGHADERVNASVRAAIEDGTLFALTTIREVELAQQIMRMTGVDKIRFANSGTEATMHALRIARAYTGRENLLKFEGDYHGMHDYVLYSTASTKLANFGPRSQPANSVVSKGIPKDIAKYVTNLPYNDLEMLEEWAEKHGETTACVIVEPTMGNVAGILPRPGFLEKIRELCDRYGMVMIMDEVKTGFRLGKGGAQEYFGVRADLVTYAKSLGNGYPIAAIAGKEEVMMTVAPGEFSHGGTYTANAVGIAAAQAVLKIMETEPVFETVHARGTELMQGIDEILTRRSVPHAMTGHPAMFAYILGTDVPPLDARDYCMGNDALYEAISLHMVANGIFPETDGREPWFMCAAHSKADIALTLEKFEDAVKASI